MQFVKKILSYLSELKEHFFEDWSELLPFHVKG